jgi:hypothetical protein
MRRSHSRRCENDRRSRDKSGLPVRAHNCAPRLCVRTTSVHPRSTNDSSRSAKLNRSSPSVDSREKAVITQLLTSFSLQSGGSLTGADEHVGRTHLISSTALAVPRRRVVHRMRRIGDDECQRSHGYPVRRVGHQQPGGDSSVWRKRQPRVDHGARMRVVGQLKGFMDNPESNQWPGRSENRIHGPTESERLSTTRPRRGVGSNGRGQSGGGAMSVLDFAIECRRRGRPG